MTREEAIRCLDVYSSTNGSGLCTDKQHYEAKQMAIKALEQVPTDDTTLKDIFYMGCEYKEQEQKTGHWKKYDNPRCEEQLYFCTNCSYYINFGKCGDFYTKEFKYCPNCGAKMESEDKE